MMIESLESVVRALVAPMHLEEALTRAGRGDTARMLNASFLITLARELHPVLRWAIPPQWEEVARFYFEGIDRIHREIETVCRNDPDFAEKLAALVDWVSDEAHLADTDETAERFWVVFSPEAAGILAHRAERVEALRRKRTVNVLALNTAPIVDPAREMLFTSNVLLTLPSGLTPVDDLPFSEHLKEKIVRAADEAQFYWFDHPIQIGVEPRRNEMLYGLRGLDEAAEFERVRGNLSEGEKLTCVLSVSVTHRGLQHIAREYLEEEFARTGRLKHIDLYVFTEEDTRRIVKEILVPVARRYLGRDDAADLLDVFGVDGKYGRHYCFLKAIAALWHVLVQPKVRAAFKIDLDQVFPQRELVEQTGKCALEHFMTPLWGARGVDAEGRLVELGMIAGALVNESDIGKGLFIPDVTFPDQALAPDELVFYSRLPQALSTEAEMMMRYGEGGVDGRRTCLRRIHVTGGTNGILVECLRRDRPFTPSFIGRAEDQAYILSVLPLPGAQLAYFHEAGLIMRHDKKAFAQEAIEAARIEQQLGDYVRLLYFSAHARVLTGGKIGRLKEIIDPFTGGFVSRIPMTVMYLRFALKAESLFEAGQDKRGRKFVRQEAARLAAALDFVSGENSQLEQTYEQERQGWDLFYDILAVIEDRLNDGDAFALALRGRATRIIESLHTGK